MVHWRKKIAKNLTFFPPTIITPNFLLTLPSHPHLPISLSHPASTLSPIRSHQPNESLKPSSQPQPPYHTPHHCPVGTPLYSKHQPTYTMWSIAQWRTTSDNIFPVLVQYAVDQYSPPSPTTLNNPHPHNMFNKQIYDFAMAADWSNADLQL